MLVNNQFDWKLYLTDIRFWIILFFIIRLFGITNPPLDSATLWRQSDVLMIARNFYEIDPNILYPRIDVGINSNGTITGVEFPIYNYCIFLLAKIFGYQHWYGRIINLLVASLGIFYFNKLISRYFNKETGFYASMLLLVSAWFAYSRTTFPDIFAASLCIIALHFCFRYLEQGKIINIIIFTLLSAAGCLSKISASSLLTVLLVPFFHLKIPTNRKIVLATSAVVILTIVSTWYFFWVPYLNSIGEGGYFSMGFPMADGIRDILAEPGRFAKKFYDDPLKYTGTAMVLTSIYLSIKQKKILAMIIAIIPLIAFFIFILKSGKWFYINGYYFVMLVPSIVLLCGFGLSLIKNKKVQLAILIIVATENIANQIHVFKISELNFSYVELDGLFDSLGSSKNDLIAVGCDECSAASIYMSHRKGIILNIKAISDSSTIMGLQQKGISYILIQKRHHGIEVSLPYHQLYDSENFKIYKL